MKQFIVLLALAGCGSDPDGIFQSPQAQPDAATTIDSGSDSAHTDAVPGTDGDAKVIQCPGGMMPTGNACIDKENVTKKDFWQWAVVDQAGKVTYPATSSCSAGMWSCDDAPVVSVTYCAGLVYCGWIGKRHCTVAEWQAGCAKWSGSWGSLEWMCPGESSACATGKWGDTCEVVPVNGSTDPYQGPKAMLRCCADPI